MDNPTSPISWFRAASPYISHHQGKTFVVYVPGHCVAQEALASIIQDLVLVSSLGVRLVLVHGAATQINEALAAAEQTSEFAQGIRVTTPDILPSVASGIQNARI